MKNLKVNWPVLIAIALASTLISCHNEKQREEARAQQANDYVTKIEQAIEEAKQKIILFPEVDEIIYPEEQESEEKGFSR